MLLLILAVTLIVGCATPQVQNMSHTEILQPDEEDDLGGTFLESGDIRTIATKMTGELLSIDEIAMSPSTIYIAISPIRNSSRFIIDKDIIMKRLRIELNRVAAGKIRFVSQRLGQDTRRQILQEQDEELWDEIIDKAAEHIVKSHVIAQSRVTPTIAVIPVRNTNIAGLNADSFTSLIRARIAEESGGKVHFLAREKNGKVIEEMLDEVDLKAMGLLKSRRMKELYGADYFLSGEFIGQSMTEEGMTEKVEYKETTIHDNPIVVEREMKKSQQKPNVAKYLNVMLIDAETGEVPVEKLVKVERKLKSGLGRVNYIITGELSGLSKATAGGTRSDYLIMSFQLIDPVTNMMIWEDAYETKKKSSASVLYR
jgi:hypothetical protein